MDDKYIDLFERYISNQLSDREKRALEQEILTDVTIKKEFDSFKALHAGIRLNVMQEKLKMLKDIDTHANNDSAKANDNSFPKHYWIVLVGLIGLSLLVYYVVTIRKTSYQIKPSDNTPTGQSAPIEKEPQTTDSLSKKELIPFIPEQDTLVKSITKPPKVKREMAVGGQKKSLWQNAMSLYQRPESFAMILRNDSGSGQDFYQKAVALFTAKNYEAVIAQLKDKQDEKSQYLVAHAYLLSGKTEQAALIFRTMAADDFSMFYDDAKWYLSLCLLSQYPESKDELTSILADLEKTVKYANQVEKIKSQLK